MPAGLTEGLPSVRAASARSMRRVTRPHQPRSLPWPFLLAPPGLNEKRSGQADMGPLRDFRIRLSPRDRARIEPTPEAEAGAARPDGAGRAIQLEPLAESEDRLDPCAVRTEEVRDLHLAELRRGPVEGRRARLEEV